MFIIVGVLYGTSGKRKRKGEWWSICISYNTSVKVENIRMYIKSC
jgi:hypothetical protein